MNPPSVTLKVQFIDVGSKAQGLQAAYGNIIGKDGKPVPSSHFNINAPKELGSDLRSKLDTDAVYEVTITKVA